MNKDTLSKIVILGIFLSLLSFITGLETTDADSTLPYWRLVDDDPQISCWSMAMAYDSERQFVVMFGGRNGSVLANTLEYDGDSWQQVSTSQAPAPRFWHSMAYDSNRECVVLFGGQNYTAAWFGDTWEYDGNDWQPISTSNSPPPMSQMSMAYDSWRNRIVLFGGQNSTGDLAETWEYDGLDWSKVNTPASPPRGTLAAMAFDSIRGKVVLFGSGVVLDGHLSDCATWEYDGATWTKINTVASPPGRWAHAMAYYLARGSVVLFGGYGPTYPSGSQFGDTWEYDGVNWTQIGTSTSPPAREQHAMAYDTVRRCVVMFGGSGSGSKGDTWEYVSPVAVGGKAYPVNGASVLVPWIAVAVLLAGGISWYALRRRSARS
jgi:hypothetical protein